MGFKRIKYLASGSAISALNDSIGYARTVKLFSCFAKDFCQYEMSAFRRKRTLVAAPSMSALCHSGLRSRSY